MNDMDRLAILMAQDAVLLNEYYEILKEIGIYRRLRPATQDRLRKINALMQRNTAEEHGILERAYARSPRLKAAGNAAFEAGMETGIQKTQEALGLELYAEIFAAD